MVSYQATCASGMRIKYLPSLFYVLVDNPTIKINRLLCWVYALLIQFLDKAYFDELVRVSKHQIIWGCNYFDYSFGSGRIVWDKCNGNSSYSNCLFHSIHAVTIHIDACRAF